MFRLSDFKDVSGAKPYLQAVTMVERLSVEYIMNCDDKLHQVVYIQAILVAFRNTTEYDSGLFFLSQALSKHVLRIPELRHFEPPDSFKEQKDSGEYLLMYVAFDLYEWAANFLDPEVVGNALSTRQLQQFMACLVNSDFQIDARSKLWNIYSRFVIPRAMEVVPNGTSGQSDMFAFLSGLCHRCSFCYDAVMRVLEAGVPVDFSCKQLIAICYQLYLFYREDAGCGSWSKGRVDLLYDAVKKRLCHLLTIPGEIVFSNGPDRQRDIDLNRVTYAFFSRGGDPVTHLSIMNYGFNDLSLWLVRKEPMCGISSLLSALDCASGSGCGNHRVIRGMMVTMSLIEDMSEAIPEWVLEDNDSDEDYPTSDEDCFLQRMFHATSSCTDKSFFRRIFDMPHKRDQQWELSSIETLFALYLHWKDYTSAEELLDSCYGKELKSTIGLWLKACLKYETDGFGTSIAECAPADNPCDVEAGIAFYKRLLQETGFRATLEDNKLLADLMHDKHRRMVEMLLLPPFNVRLTDDLLQWLTKEGAERIDTINQELFAPGGRGFECAASSYEESSKRQRVD